MAKKGIEPFGAQFFKKAAPVVKVYGGNKEYCSGYTTSGSDCSGSNDTVQAECTTGRVRDIGPDGEYQCKDEYGL